MRIILEREKCIGCGSCVALCSKYFEILDDGKSNLKKSKKNQETGNFELEITKIECVKDAAEVCSVQIIHIITKK